MFKKVLIISCFFLIFNSCNNNKKKSFYYSTGELLSEVEYNKRGIKNGILKEFYKTGELKGLVNYNNGTIVDTAKRFYKNGKIEAIEIYSLKGKYHIEYYENGKIKKEGNVFDSLVTDSKYWWKYYSKNGNLKMKIEYFRSGNKTTPNQRIFYDNEGAILKDSSNYFSIVFPDTLVLGKPSFGSIDLIPDLSIEQDFHKVYFWYEDKNGDKMGRDSTFGKNFQSAPIWYVPNQKGEQKLMGYILEKGSKMKKKKKQDSLVEIDFLSRKLHFDKTIYVKDSID